MLFLKFYYTIRTQKNVHISDFGHLNGYRVFFFEVTYLFIFVEFYAFLNIYIHNSDTE